MIKTILNKPYIVIYISLIVAIIGVYKFFNIPIALYPQASKINLGAWQSYDGISSDAFYERYGKSIETRLSSDPDIEKVEASYYKRGVQFAVNFAWTISSEEAKKRFNELTLPVTSQLPTDWGKTQTWIQSSNEKEIAITLRIPPEKLNSFNDYYYNTIQPRIQSEKDVENVQYTDTTSQELTIELIPEKMMQYRVSLSEIKRSIDSQRYNNVIGSQSFPDKNYTFIEVKKIKNVNELRQLVVKESDKGNITLADVATLNVKKQQVKTKFVVEGQLAQGIFISPKPTANINNFSKQSLKLISELTTAFDPNIKSDVLLDPGVFISSAITNIGIAIALSTLIAAIILFLFLGSISSTLITAVSMPLSLIGGFIIMDFAGIEINLLSLGAMALAVGMVVDGATVVIENCARHIAINGYDKVTFPSLVQKATSEVASSLSLGVLTTVVVFIPLIFTKPMIAAILGDLAKVMTSVLLLSIIVAIFVIPSLIIIIKPKFGSSTQKFSKGFEWVKKIYLKSLRWLLTHPKTSHLSFLLIVSLFAGSIYVMVKYIPRDIISKPHAVIAMVHVKLKQQDKDYTIEETEKITKSYELKFYELMKPFSKLNFVILRGNHQVTFFTILNSSKQLPEAKTILEKEFIETPDMQFYVRDFMPISLELPEPPVARFFVNANSRDERYKMMDEISKSIRQTDKFGQVSLNPYPSSEQQLNTQFKKSAISRMQSEKSSSGSSQITINEIQEILKLGTSNKWQFTSDFDAKNTEVYLRFPENYFENLNSLLQFPLFHEDKAYPLQAFIELTKNKVYTSFQSLDGKEANYIEVWAKHGTELKPEEAQKIITDTIKADAKWDINQLRFEDTQTEINDNLKSLLLAVGVSLIVLFSLLIIQYNSLKDTWIIGKVIIFAIIGATVSLLIFKSKIDINSMLGLILLIGTAVNNSILFVDFFNALHQQKENLIEDILEAAGTRLRPILITTLTTILGMIPIAVGFGEGGEVLKPLGIAVSGGLGVSTLLMLYYVPLSYIPWKSQKQTLMENN